MSNIQEVFSRIRKNKEEQKKLKEAYKDALENSPSYREINEEFKEIKIKKKQIESDTKAQFSAELTRLEDMKIDLESDLEMLSDIALNKIIKGEEVKVVDEHETEYEPVFSVKFKKIN